MIMIGNIVYGKLITIFTIVLSITTCANSQWNFDASRQKMVNSQIAARGITDKQVLAAMRAVPRHKFVIPEWLGYSYDDRPLPIGYGQTISQPYIVALMTELLDVDRKSVVLEIGTGSGYQAAILSKIVKEVHSIEIVKELYQRTAQIIKDMGYSNIKTKWGDGYYGWGNKARYDAIIVTCASSNIPPPLIKQLKIGGVMCIPVGPPFMTQNLLLVTKLSEDDIRTQVITRVRFVPLIRAEKN